MSMKMRFSVSEDSDIDPRRVCYSMDSFHGYLYIAHEEHHSFYGEFF